MSFKGSVSHLQNIVGNKQIRQVMMTNYEIIDFIAIANNATFDWKINSLLTKFDFWHNRSLTSFDFWHKHE